MVTLCVDISTARAESSRRNDTTLVGQKRLLQGSAEGLVDGASMWVEEEENVENSYSRECMFCLQQRFKNTVACGMCPRSRELQGLNVILKHNQCIVFGAGSAAMKLLNAKFQGAGPLRYEAVVLRDNGARSCVPLQR